MSLTAGIDQSAPENRTKRAVGLRDFFSHVRGVLESDEVLVNPKLVQQAEPGFELGWEAGIRTPHCRRFQLIDGVRVVVATRW